MKLDLLRPKLPVLKRFWCRYRHENYHGNEASEGYDSNPGVKSVEIVVTPIQMILHHRHKAEHNEHYRQEVQSGMYFLVS